ncbi:MAG TPA: hypothetical protein VFE23_01295 [Usitatibacter sp.]|jgi:hypothetical protein|nr:hypothetical protein [Usitatibacter sp.]
MSGAVLSRARFEAALDQVFTVSADGSPGALEVRLVEVKPRPAPPGHEQFSALFAGPATPAWPQGTYRFANEAFGSVELFMVPLGPAASRTEYEVCVSGPVAPGPA